MSFLLERFYEDPTQFSLDESLVLLNLPDLPTIEREDFEFLTILKYDLLELQNKDHDDAIERRDIPYFCCGKNYMITFKWYINLYPEELDRDLIRCFSQALGRNDLDLLNFLYHKYGKSLKDIEGNIIFSVYRSSNLKTLEWILERFDDNKNFQDKLIDTLSNEDTSIFKWLIKKHQLSYDTLLNNILRCLASDQIFKFFIDAYLGYINPDDINKLFKRACSFSKLEIAKYIYNIYNRAFLSFDDHMFKYSIEILNWIREIRPDMFRAKLERYVNYQKTRHEKVIKLAIEMNIDFDVNWHFEDAYRHSNGYILDILSDHITLDYERAKKNTWARSIYTSFNCEIFSL